MTKRGHLWFFITYPKGPNYCRNSMLCSPFKSNVSRFREKNVENTICWFVFCQFFAQVLLSHSIHISTNSIIGITISIETVQSKHSGGIYTKVLLENGWNSKQMIPKATLFHWSNQEKSKQRSASS